ncbi:hypothetical protein CASFOL_000616 [Castilleja foliolosa]|uniref:Poly A polymerase head domain-containing protein n=1 Tax=Castilleja foliolosa TaxID=1961234 RepID=A0ABD3EKP1_9LAMI
MWARQRRPSNPQTCLVNPDQSKHLETVTMRLFDVWIDFVNLRSEEYIEESRILTEVRYGTPEEDAKRRDLTINSSFYNINGSSVEDLTGRGIADLKAGKIVTPSSPKQTFIDDPLRVLRAIRFGARFGFVLDEELKIAAADNDVRKALADKISKERIGHEDERVFDEIASRGSVLAVESTDLASKYATLQTSTSMYLRGSGGLDLDLNLVGETNDTGHCVEAYKEQKLARQGLIKELESQLLVERKLARQHVDSRIAKQHRQETARAPLATKPTTTTDSDEFSFCPLPINESMEDKENNPRTTVNHHLPKRASLCPQKISYPGR